MQTKNTELTIDSYISSIRHEYEQNLKALVDIPSVSADPQHKKDIEGVAAAASTLLKSSGAEVQVLKTEGYPVIIGEFKNNPDWPTLTIYNHLDVQPADAVDWKAPPFLLP